MAGTILHVNFDVNLGGRQTALGEVHKKRTGKSILELEEGEIVIFINRAMDKVSAIAGTGIPGNVGVLGYYKQFKGKLDLMAIKYIALAFGAKGFQMEAAIRSALEDRFGKAKSKEK